MNSMRWSEPSQQGGNGNSSSQHHLHRPHPGAATESAGTNAGGVNGAPTIKNHSVTYFNGFLYCFGGYDGRRNHMTLLLYSLAEQRWIRSHHIATPSSTTGIGDETEKTMASLSLLPASELSGGGGAISENNENSTIAIAASTSAGLHHLPDEGGISGSAASAPSFYGLGSAGDQTIVVQGTPPPGRNGHSATLAVDPDDEDAGRIIIIGGWLGTGPLAASDMHVLDISNNGRSLNWHQPSVKGTPPGPCNMHSADFVKQKREVYVFRGGNGREYLNDLHALSTDTLVWRRVETVGTIPQQRANHSSAILEDTAELFIFGGWNGTERLNDIHILNTATSTWTCPHVGGCLPHPRAGMTLTALRGRLFLFGGSGTSAKCFQDLQILDRSEMAWLDVNTSATNSSDEEASHDMNAISVERHRYDGELSHYNHQQQYPHSYDADDGENRFRFGGSYVYGNKSDAAAVSAANGHWLERPQQQGDGWHNNKHNAYGKASSGGQSIGVGGRQTFTSTALSPNPNDEDTVPMVLLQGRGPGRRAGHTATAVGRHIYIFGGSCGSDYLNDFFKLDTDPPPATVITEPTSLQQVERRLVHFFNDQEFSDVTFIVQGRPLYGHKMVLSSVSDCFRAMFSAGFRERADNQIEIPDCSYQAFYSVLEYIYTGRTHWPRFTTPSSAAAELELIIMPSSNSQDGSTSSFSNSSSNMNNNTNLMVVVEMLELADRFFLDHLKQICETILQPAVGAETVEYLLSVAQKTNAAQLMSICEHRIRNRDECQ